MGVNTTGLLNTQTEVYASYKNDAVTKNETAAKKDSTAGHKGQHFRYMSQ